MATPCSGGGGTGTQYSYAELEGLWINAGGSRQTAPIAAAIGLAESKGCSVAQNPNDNNGTQTSWGIWNISDGTHNMPVPGIYDPAVNAQEAVSKWKAAGGQFTDWGTFTSGAYRGFLSGKTTPDTNVPGTGTQANPSACNVPDCAWGCIPSVTILGATVWQGPCLITYKQAREGLGVLILVGGALVSVWGVQLLIGVAALGVASKVVAPVVEQVGGAKATASKARSLFGKGRQRQPAEQPARSEAAA